MPVVAPGDEKLAIAFDMHPVLNEEKSRLEGRPIYDEVPYITIQVPGDNANQIHRPFWDDPLSPASDSRRFGRQYADWKAGKAPGATGTPLAAWPAMTRAEVAELAHFNVTTVEQLADMADVHAQKFPGIQRFKKLAQDFIAAAKELAPLTKMRAELEERDATIEGMKQQLAALEAEVKKKASK
jgi:hypothetical protein